MNVKPAELFEAADFRNPPAFLWPGYFWVLNDRLSEPKLLEQLRDMNAMGARSVCLLTEPPEFRPQTMGTEVDLPYLSEEYFAMIRTVVAEAARLGMNFWLYDEGGWPSGGAAGRVLAADPARHALKKVVFSESAIGADGRYTVPRDVLWAAVGRENSWRSVPAGSTIDRLPAGTKLRLFKVESDRTRYEAEVAAGQKPQSPYADVLCPAAVAKFIELTHERFHRHVGEHFGNTIRFAFTDEPSCTATEFPNQLTWTGDLAEAFRVRKGYDLVPLLPQLFVPPAGGEPATVTRARVDVYDVWSQLFVERYLLPIRDWCRAHGLVSAGHFGGEDEPRYNADAGYGHILRALRGLDLPGVDTIWRQLHPGVRSHPFPKYASSVARQLGQPYVLTESFAVYGNGLTPAEMKWITDQQYVRGANLMVGACYPYSTRDHFMPGERPHFGPANPLWKYLDLYHAYAARLGYVVSRGRAVCATAVYFDVRSIWAGGTGREEAIRLHEELARGLLEAQCDFDFIDDDLLAGKGSRIEAGRLIADAMAYDTILVPATNWMDATALRGLAEFQRTGGTVVPVAGLPAADGGLLRFEELIEPPAVASLESAAGLVRRVCRLAPESPGIRACARDGGLVRLYILTNEADRPVRVTATFAETGPAVRLDPEDGGRYLLKTIAGNDGEAVDLAFEPWGSIVLLFGDVATSASEWTKVVTSAGRAESTRWRSWLQIPVETISLANGWTLRPVCQHIVGEHDFERIDRAGAAAVSARLGDWAAVLGHHFSGDGEYAVSFDCSESQSRRPARLDLGEVKYACAVTLNGVKLGRRIWKPFAFDVTGRLRSGRNELRVVVTNTLANALLDPVAEARWRAMPGPGWPSCGHTYDTRAREFEKDSLPSGWYGPVTLELGTEPTGHP